jgi:hypothetical protein
VADDPEASGGGWHFRAGGQSFVQGESGLTNSGHIGTRQMQRTASSTKRHMRRVLSFVGEEFVHALPAMVFFAAGFNLVVFSMNLILSQYFVQFGSFMVATTMALVVGKAVLVADKMSFLSRFESGPLILPILFKTCVYTIFVFIARLIEAYVHYLIETGRLIGFFPFLYDHFSWHRFAFVQLWIFVLFLVFATGTELNRLLGHGMLARLFFMHQSSRFKIVRRDRIRILVQLSRITERHPIGELEDPNTDAHHKMVALLTSLTLNERNDHPR